MNVTAPRRRWSFSLRTLFVVVTALACIAPILIAQQPSPIQKLLAVSGVAAINALFVLNVTASGFARHRQKALTDRPSRFRGPHEGSNAAPAADPDPTAGGPTRKSTATAATSRPAAQPDF